VIAVAAKESNNIEIYRVPKDLNNPSSWELIYTLKEHQLPITALDWSVNNQIMSGNKKT
jgi:hypothetical protein